MLGLYAANLDHNVKLPFPYEDMRKSEELAQEANDEARCMIAYERLSNEICASGMSTGATFPSFKQYRAAVMADVPQAEISHLRIPKLSIIPSNAITCHNNGYSPQMGYPALGDRTHYGFTNSGGPDFMRSIYSSSPMSAVVTATSTSVAQDSQLPRLHVPLSVQSTAPLLQ